MTTLWMSRHRAIRRLLDLCTLTPGVERLTVSEKVASALRLVKDDAGHWLYEPGIRVDPARRTPAAAGELMPAAATTFATLPAYRVVLKDTTTGEVRDVRMEVEWVGDGGSIYTGGEALQFERDDDAIDPRREY